MCIYIFVTELKLKYIFQENQWECMWEALWKRNESVGSILTGTFLVSAFAYKFAFLRFWAFDYKADVQELQIQNCLS